MAGLELGKYSLEPDTGSCSAGNGIAPGPLGAESCGPLGPNLAVFRGCNFHTKAPALPCPCPHLRTSIPAPGLLLLVCAFPALPWAGGVSGSLLPAPDACNQEHS